MCGGSEYVSQPPALRQRRAVHISIFGEVNLPMRGATGSTAGVHVTFIALELHQQPRQVLRAGQ